MRKKKATDTEPDKIKPKSSEKAKRPTKKDFPVVGIGASAGGLEALKAFFAEVSENSGMAYIVVVHMASNQPSMMPELLQNITSIPVSATQDGQSIEPNHVYVITPNQEITVFKKKIQLMDIVEKGVSHPIDFFFKSLGQDQGSNSAAVILSGTGTDGTTGLKEIKANDGLVLVQSEETSLYDGMPKSAINTGLVDMILPSEKMPQKLKDYFSHPQTQISKIPANDQQKWIYKIFAILRTRVGHDFSKYKMNTIFRRIAHRMGLNHIEQHEVYVKFLRENPSEVNALFRELLIGVTSFFRDAESFEQLKEKVSEIVSQAGDDTTFRAWIPGCSTGEEVYSLAIILRECFEELNKQITLQLFGTDIDKFAIDKAREGLFPTSISSELSNERLKRFFTKEGDFYRVRKELRNCAVFSIHDVIKDPPFSRLNLLSCRNLLIYLKAEAQKKLLPLFHYTLIPNGFLMLGTSETIGGFTNLFKVVDKKWKIFERKQVPNALRQIVDFPSGLVSQGHSDGHPPQTQPTQKINIGQLTQKIILDQFAPTAILTDEKGEILHIQGRTGKYLEPPSGSPTYNIMDMARQGLKIELSSALRSARSSGKKETRRRISVKSNGDVQIINLHVVPQQTPKKLAGKLLIVFEDVDEIILSSDSDRSLQDISSKDISKIADLERELQITRESQQVIVEELESSNEELQSTNEELQSTNEEMQSTSEEMESSKEELQSLNEELQTVNSELQSKVEELSAAHDDMHNLLNSTEIATIFLDIELRIRRFTSESTKIVNLIQTDIGRPLKHVVSNLVYENMISDCKEVLEKLIPKEREVQTMKGSWFNMRLIPYRTMDNRIDGVVLTFSPIDDQKNAQQQITQALSLTRSIFDMHQEPMMVLDKDGKMIIANEYLTKIIGKTQNQLKRLDILSISETARDKKALKRMLDHSWKETGPFTIENFKIKKQNFVIEGQIIDPDVMSPSQILLRFNKKE